jgi:hypothetical protein
MSVYHRLLRLRHYRPGTLVTAVLFEGSIVAAVVLSLAEILEWWSVLVVPVAVAAVVKFNDLVAGLPTRPAPQLPVPARGVARVPAPTGGARRLTPRG